MLWQLTLCGVPQNPELQLARLPQGDLTEPGMTSGAGRRLQRNWGSESEADWEIDLEAKASTQPPTKKLYFDAYAAAV